MGLFRKYRKGKDQNMGIKNVFASKKVKWNHFRSILLGEILDIFSQLCKKIRKNFLKDWLEIFVGTENIFAKYFSK